MFRQSIITNARNCARNFDVIEESRENRNEEIRPRYNLCFFCDPAEHLPKKRYRDATVGNASKRKVGVIISSVFPVRHPLESREIGGAVFRAVYRPDVEHRQPEKLSSACTILP